jgi:toxin ParE1/3/4
MKLVWSPTGERNLDLIWEFIAQDNLNAADRIRKMHPRMGRSGRARGTRELIVSGTPYLLIYRVSETEVEIARVLHGAQEWPRRG